MGDYAVSRTLSAAALKAMFSADSDDVLITLITIKADVSLGIPTDIVFADNYTGRLTALTTDAEVIYGVTSTVTGTSVDYPFMPVEIALPNDDNTSSARCSITIHDVTRYLLPSIRSITGAPLVEIRLVLASTPNTLEASYTGFRLSNVSYNANTITAELNMPSMEVEPFPAHSFTPAYFPGLF